MKLTARDIFGLSENEARKLLESIRWPDGAVCPHCQSRNVGKLTGKTCRPGLYKCKNPDCRKQFTVTVNTIFERSHISLRNWIYTFHRVCASKKGISALQIQRELGCSYKAAWFMCHRIRHAMQNEPLKGMLKGVVESDETYIGGKPRKLNYGGTTGQQGRTTKTPVQVLVERDGQKRSLVLPRVNVHTLRRNLRQHVQTDATIMTDKAKVSRNIAIGFKDHKRVDHGNYEYYRHQDEAGINTAESAFALLKRGVYGSFHHVSKEHLQRYCDEFDYRWNHRKVTDVERTMQALKQTEGVRLTYKEPARKLK